MTHKIVDYWVEEHLQGGSAFYYYDKPKTREAKKIKQKPKVSIGREYYFTPILPHPSNSERNASSSASSTPTLSTFLCLSSTRSFVNKDSK
jgi:hypothetical protein